MLCAQFELILFNVVRTLDCFSSQEDGTFLFSRFRGRPHPTLLHQSADATMSLLKSIWIDEKNMAEQSAEIQEQATGIDFLS